MNDRSWFRLLVRGIGMVILGFSAPKVIVLVAGVIAALSSSGTQGVFQDDYLLQLVVAGLACLVQLAFGIYLLFFGDGLIRLCLRDVDARCVHCQHSLVGVAGDRCPECGSGIRPAREAGRA